MTERVKAWFSFYPGDYLRDTMGLTTLQHGAYFLLLMAYWSSGPLEHDPEALRSIARLDRKTWDREVAGTVLRFFRVGEGGRLYQKRMDREIAKASHTTSVRRDAAHSRWNANGHASDDDLQSNNDANADANALQASRRLTRARVPQSQSQPEKRREPPLPLPDWMPLPAWEGYVAMRRSSRHPLNEHQVKLLLIQLGAMYRRGVNVAEALDQSTRAGWRGVFEPKSGPPPQRSRAQKLRDSEDEEGST